MSQAWILTGNNYTYKLRSDWWGMCWPAGWYVFVHVQQNTPTTSIKLKTTPEIRTPPLIRHYMCPALPIQPPQREKLEKIIPEISQNRLNGRVLLRCTSLYIKYVLGGRGGVRDVDTPVIIAVTFNSCYRIPLQCHSLLRGHSNLPL